MNVSPVVLAALSAAQMSGVELKLVEQLDRPTYTAVNKVLEAAGGKWNKKLKAHVFDGDAADAIDPIILTGQVHLIKQDFGQFDTPPALADSIVIEADLEPGMKVLEPSAGVGNLVAAIIAHQGSGEHVFAYEIDEKRLATCRSRNWKAFGAGGIGHADFLEIEPNPIFDRVIMNPPFAKQADIDHVTHAERFLKRGGRLVAIMSAGVSFRRDQKAMSFRDLVADRNGTISPLPADSFKESGTKVSTVVVKMTA